MTRSWARGAACAVLVLATAACSHSRLLAATSRYSIATVTAVGELRSAPGILGELCRTRMELAYLEHRLMPGSRVGPIDEYARAPIPAGSGHGPTSWSERCAGLKSADDAFLRGLAAIEQYSVALGGFADQDLVSEVNLEALTAAGADDLARLSGEARPYRDAIAGLGAPLASLARAIQGRWKARKLAGLVARTDAPLHEVVAQLREFIGVVRRGYLRDARMSVHDVVALIDGTREPTDVAALVLASRLDIELTRHLDQLDARLRALDDALAMIADGHAKLASGWQRGESHGLATVKAIARFAREVHRDVRLFRAASRGGES